MMMNDPHTCRCETDGWCHLCRNDSVDRYQSYEELGQGYREMVHCTWCRKNITYLSQHILGDFNDHRKVCGVNCPKRPAAPTDKTAPTAKSAKHESYEVDYRASGRISITAVDENSAKKWAKVKLKRDGFRGVDIKRAFRT